MVNSANTRLLTPGVTGIAGALLALDRSGALLRECDNVKRDRGGEVPVGSAVWTSAGGMGCRGIAHAVTLRYRKRVRESATPAAVGRAFGEALRLADEAGCTSLACYVMCARARYSTVEPSSDAPAVMLRAMVAALRQLAPVSLRRVLLFVPSDERDGVPRLLLPPGAPLLAAPRVLLWCGARGHGAEQTTARLVGWRALLSAASMRVEYREGPHTSAELAALVAAFRPWALLVEREEGGETANLVRAARACALRLVLTAAAPTAAQLVELWDAGAHWVTDSMPSLLELLRAAAGGGVMPNMPQSISTAAVESAAAS